MDRIKGKVFLLNGQVLPITEFNPDIINHGTTIYELIKIKDCVPLWLEKYLKRTENSLGIIGRRAWFSPQELIEQIRRIIRLNCVKDEDHLKILISFDNDLFSPPQNILTLFFTTVPIPSQEAYRNGVRTVSLNARRINPNAKVYQPMLRSRSEELIRSLKIYEVILLTEDNFITEGSRSNVFFITPQGRIITPSLADVLPGITRSNVIDLARDNGIPLEEKRVHYEELSGFDAAFLTGTSRKILPIRSIDNIEFNPQNPVLQKLIRLYDEKISDYVQQHREQYQDLCQCE